MVKKPEKISGYPAKMTCLPSHGLSWRDSPWLTNTYAKEMAMEHAIVEIERLCQDKILLFHELMQIIKDEKKTIISADVGSLWKFTRSKHIIADKIDAIRNQIMQTAFDSGILDPEQIEGYSLLKIIAALPRKDTVTLANLRYTLTGVKTRITAMAHENKRYLEESMRTIEDLVQIILKNCERNERYGRDTYLRPSYNTRPGLVRREV